MKYIDRKYILEAVQKGIQLALDDYEEQDNTIIVPAKNSVKQINAVQKSLFLNYIEKMKDLSLSAEEYKNFKKILKVSKLTYKVKDSLELSDIVEYFRRKTYTLKANLNWIDTSNVTNMSYLFANCDFNGNISEWDTSNVTTMASMFYNDHKFNCNISKWNVSNVRSMYNMFYRAYEFNQDISDWDVSHVQITEEMFYKAESFNQDLTKWKLIRILNKRNMFNGSCLDNEENKKKQPKEYSDFEINIQLAIDREMEGK